MSVRLVKGNEAVVLGALAAGCDSFFGYPITPASEITHAAASYFPQAGRIFLQAESETAAISMVYGAAGAGKRTMTASSGPGISLMQEGISYLAGAELPCVIVNIMRAGPGLGNIGPEQSDYNQAVKGGGHGNYHNIVLAPESVQEMCDFTMWAFELAFRYRNPAIVLADAVLGQMMETLRLPTVQEVYDDVRPWAVQADAATRGNVITSIVLDPDELEAHNLKLQAKYTAMECEAAGQAYRTEDAELLLVGYGICSRLARTAIDRARLAGRKVGLFRPMTLQPFPRRELQELAGRCRELLVVELSNGQLLDDVRLTCGDRLPIRSLTRVGGNLVTVDAIVEKIG